jgi:hypothetical protein
MNNQLNTIQRSREELLDECLDLRLPVKTSDRREILEAHLLAVYDEAEQNSRLPENYDDGFDLDKDPVYIGRNDFNITRILGKLLTFF